MVFMHSETVKVSATLNKVKHSITTKNQIISFELQSRSESILLPEY